MAGIPWELGGRHSSDGSDGLVDMLVYKDAEAPVARYCRLVDDKIFQMVPSDVSKPVEFTSLAGVHSMEENEATLTVSLKMPKHILAMQATNVSAYINWRDQLRERLHSRNAAGSATKLRFSEFNESSPDRERPRTASPSRTRTPPRSPPRSPDKDLVHGVSSPTRTPQRSPDRGESIHDFPSRPGSAAAESRRNPELGEYWNGSESETSFLLPASPADSSKRGSKGQVRVPARQVQHYVQGMVESYQALLRRKSVGSVESPGMDYRNGPSVGLLKKNNERLLAEEAVLLDENNKLQETVLQLTDQLRLTRKANIELQKQAASLASTANEALTQAEILRGREMKLQRRLKDQITESSERKQDEYERMIDAAMENVENRFTLVLQNQAARNERAMEDLARRSDDITTESIRQRDKLLLRQSGKLEQAMAQASMMEDLRLRYERALSEKERACQERMRETREEAARHKEEQRLHHAMLVRDMQAEFQAKEDTLRGNCQEKLMQACEIADQELANVRREKAAKDKELGNTRERLLKQINQLKQEMERREDKAKLDVRDWEMKVETAELAAHHVRKVHPENGHSMDANSTIQAAKIQKAVEGNLRKLLEAKKLECAELKSQLLFAQAKQS